MAFVSAAAARLAATAFILASVSHAYAPNGALRPLWLPGKIVGRCSTFPRVKLNMASDDSDRVSRETKRARGSKIKNALKNKAVKAAGALSTIALTTGTFPPVAFAAKEAVEVAQSTAQTIDSTRKNIAISAGLFATGVAGANLILGGTATLTSGFGISMADSTSDAVAEAMKMASADMEGEPSMAFVSCTVSRSVEGVRKEFAKALPEGCPIHGITSSGALLTKEGTKGGAVGVLLIQSDKKGSFETAYDYGNAKAAVVDLKEKTKNPRAILMSTTPGQEEGVLEDLNQYFPGVPVYGGTAADDELSGDWQVFCREAHSNTGVSLVAISRNVKVGASMLGPYEETGKRVTATKTDGRRVFEIDGKPAADWVYEWLGEDVKDQYEKGGLILPQTAQNPIGIKKPSGEYVTNHLAAFGGNEKFVDFFAPIPEGAELVVMDSGEGPATGYADALSRAYDEALKHGSLGADDPKAGILIFCGGMAIAVGENLDAGLSSDSFSSKIDKMPLLGMTCFGEQAYLTNQKENVQRNLSVGMILLG